MALRGASTEINIMLIVEAKEGDYSERRQNWIHTPCTAVVFMESSSSLFVLRTVYTIKFDKYFDKMPAKRVESVRGEHFSTEQEPIIFASNSRKIWFHPTTQHPFMLLMTCQSKYHFAKYIGNAELVAKCYSLEMVRLLALSYWFLP